MKNLVILGGGTAGTMAANKLRKHARQGEWQITVVDRDDNHHYQPGYLFMPFGTYTPDAGHQVAAQVPPRRRPTRLRRDRPGRRRGQNAVHPRPTAACCRTTTSSSRPASPRAPTRPRACDDPRVAAQRLRLLHPTRAPTALAEKLDDLATGGRLVVHITEMPIKCPVAPLEFAFLADAFFTEQGHARPGRDHLRDPARRRVHQADRRRSASATCSTSARSRSSPTS